MRSNYSFIFLLFLTLLALPVTSNAKSIGSIQINTESGVVALSSYKGQVIYLDFWASWCAPCKKSFPWLNEIQKKYAKYNFRVIAVNLDKEPELAKRFLQNYPAAFLIGYDPEGNIASQFKVNGMPSSYLIDRSGNIVSTHIGFREKDTAALESKIKALLAR